MMGKMETLSHRRVMKSPTVGKVVQPLQSVNCHDSRADGHERHGPFTRLVGISGWDLWFGLDLVDRVMMCIR
jgi:hypothetical protein